MWRPDIKNRAFDRMGERYSPVIDYAHFLGRSSFDIPWEKREVPPARIIKKEDRLFELELAIPGFTKEDLSIVVQDDVLTIRGEKTDSRRSEESEEEFIMEEFNFDSFERKFKLSPSISQEKITAKYEEGILRLTFIDVPEEEEKAYQNIKVE